MHPDPVVGEEGPRYDLTTGHVAGHAVLDGGDRAERLGRAAGPVAVEADGLVRPGIAGEPRMRVVARGAPQAAPAHLETLGPDQADGLEADDREVVGPDGARLDRIGRAVARA